MKNIKSFMLLVISLGISVLVKAQQAKEAAPQLAKKEIQTPAPAEVNLSSVPQTNQAAAEAAAMKPVKATLIQAPASPATGSLSPDQVKTLNGTAQKPEMAAAPGTEQKPAKEKPVKLVAPSGQ